MGGAGSVTPVERYVTCIRRAGGPRADWVLECADDGMRPGPMDELTTQEQVGRRSLERSDSPALLVLGQLAGVQTPVAMLRLDRDLEIGRGDARLDADAWQIPDATVSRRHASIRREGQGFVLEDRGSRNGTWLDGVVLRGESARLNQGAIVMLGAQVAAFRRMTEEQIAAIAAEQERPLGPVPTAAPGLAQSLRRLRILAGTDRPVLLAGETGTGKEVYARVVHELSGRSGPFIALNCAGFHRDLFESHLFGYKRGSHSQANQDHPGVLASAEGGTVFLDEIGEMEPALQSKLLRFLQDKTFLGLGWTRPRQADVRIVAATQSPQNTLREDILGRLGAEPVVLPPLRKRREDLPGLCRHFLRRLPPAASAVVGLERNVCFALCLYTWPRNIRELEATLGEAALSAAERGAARVDVQDLPGRIRDLLGRPAEIAATDDAEQSGSGPRPGPRRSRPTRAELEVLLREHHGHVPAVARHLERRRELVWRWCRLDGLDPNAFKDATEAGKAVPLTRNGGTG
jgi:DNA-binding NtrC family response regulator